MSIALRCLALVFLAAFTLGMFPALTLAVFSATIPNPAGWLGLGLTCWCASGAPWGRYFKP